MWFPLVWDFWFKFGIWGAKKRMERLLMAADRLRRRMALVADVLLEEENDDKKKGGVASDFNGGANEGEKNARGRRMDLHFARPA